MSSSLSKAAIDEFFFECDEIIQRVSTGLQSLEKGEPSPNVVGQIYRDMHTMKGSAQLFGFSRIGQLSHCMEACLDPIRKNHAKVNSSFIDASLKTLDLIDRIIKGVREGREESEFEPDVQGQLPRMVDEASALFGVDFRIRRDDNPDSSANRINLVETPTKETQEPPRTSEPRPEPKAEVVMVEKQVEEKGNLMKDVNSNQQVDEPAAGEAENSDHGRSDSQHPATPGAAAAQVDTTIRVQVGLLDRLMNLVGELVLVRNQVTQYTSSHDDLEFINMSQSLNVVTTELQNEVMLTRMQPIGVVVNKFQRVVRDLARDLNKKMDLTIQGAETELDKTLLEAIKDPLTHIVRNSCDHGVETPAERKAAAKPENGHILIRSFHDGGQVFIEVSDDGRGLDRDRILAKAVERKLISPERAAKMSDREICQIIFLPGFSTAKQVTNVSGRGVGMDVVKTNIERIGGTAEVVSTYKRGTTIRLKIPLTLAIVPAMLIRCGKNRFAIPQVKLVELVRVDPSENKEKIELLQGRPMYRLRGELLPIIHLDEALQNETTKAGPVRTPEQIVNSISNIVVLNAEGELFGLLVDEILDTADIVVKPMGSILKKISIFSGATILGDGAVALILDVMGLAESAKIDTKSQRRSEGFLDTVNSSKINHDAQEFLLVRVAAEAVHAFPLCLVNRLEEFAMTDVEMSGAQQVVRYRDSILPIISLNKVLGYPESKGTLERLSVVVVQRSGRNYGISVDEVLDVVTSERAIDDAIRDRAGIIGNLLFKEEVVVIVDALGIIESQANRLGAGGAAASSGRIVATTVEELKKQAAQARATKVKILFAEDVPFFRKQVGKVLANAGYEVHATEDGVQALKVLEAAPDGTFELVLSDIEMPNKNGLELARDIRANPRFPSIPMIALTTRFRQKDIEDGKKAGFSAYLEKLNADILLTTIEALLESESKSKPAEARGLNG